MAAASSSTLVQGQETLAANLQLPILSTNSKQFLRTSPPLSLPSSTETVDLLAISHRNGLLAVAAADADQGQPTSIILHPLQELRKLMRESPKGDKPELKQAWRRIRSPQDAPIQTVAFAQEESSIVAGLRDGSVVIWNLAQLRENKVSRGADIVHLLQHTIT